MQRRVFQVQPTTMRKRRVFPSQDEANKQYEEMVISALTRANRWDYGHLDKGNRLFRVRTLSAITIPGEVITKLLREGRIILSTLGYYEIVKDEEE